MMRNCGQSKKSLTLLFKIFILFFCLFAAILINEIIYFLKNSPQVTNYYIWPPHLYRVFKPSSSIMPGVEGEARFIINSQGIRADELQTKHEYRILTMGGSTTECLFLDQSEAWPYLLQEKINEFQDRHLVWVGNIARSGFTTRDILIQMKYSLDQYADIKTIIFLTGVNDFLLRCSQGNDYDPNFLDKPGSEEMLLLRVFYFRLLPNHHKRNIPFYKSTLLWNLAKNMRHILFREARDKEGRWYIRKRKLRQKAVMRDNLPDLSSAIEEYSRNIKAIIDLSRKKSIGVIFLTQPALWDYNYSGKSSELLWMGVSEDNREYYSPEALARGLKMYNQRLKEICRLEQVDCLDIVSLIQKDPNLFYDDMHFNEKGAEEISKIIAEYLIQQDPFK